MANEPRGTSSLFSLGDGSRKNRIRDLLDNVVVQFVAFAAFVATVVAILMGGIDDRDRQLDEAMIGQVAPYTVEASRDFTFTEPDVAASNELRQQVASSVPPVYDWHEDRGRQLGADVELAFESMRQALAAHAQERLDRQRQGESADDGEGEPEEDAADDREPEPLEQRALIETLSPEERVQVALQVRQEGFDEYFAPRLSESAFETLAHHGFPPDGEEAIITVLEDVMSDLIVANARRIDQERDHGIYLRRFVDGQAVIEYHITDLDDRFIGLDEAIRILEESSQAPAVGVANSELREAVTTAASALVEPNTTYNEGKTLEKRQTARESVAPQVVHEEFREGQIIVEAGHIITERDYRIIEEMVDADETYHTTQVMSGIAVFSLLLLLVLYGFGRRNIREFRPGPRDIVFMGTTLLIMLLITRVGAAVSHALAEQLGTIPVEAWYFAIPVAAGGMLIRLVLRSEHAIIFTLLFAILVGIIAANSLFFAAYTILGTLVGVTTVQQVKHRMALMWSGLAVGAINATAIIGFLLIQGELFQMSAVAHIGLGFAGGLAAGFFISAVLPVFESVFGYTTDIKLLELANLNHPLLRELILRAPGSYHHSMVVGSLCEAAAESIECNALLARVGAYYHDVGKAKNPQYFAENQRAGQNPHDKLKPNMSALIIKSHVKDGLDMARRHRLPAEIQDFIAQHHGTSLIAYFYRKAKDAEDPDIPEVTEKDYRYPGPRPQTRETAICLLADGVEAASRALPNPSAARLKGLVQTMINRAFTDGQLDECDLTLKDLNKIARAFTRILTGIYHHRPEYPEDRQKQVRDTSGSVRHRPDPSDDGAERPPADPGSNDLAESTSDVWDIDDNDGDHTGDEHARGRNDNGDSPSAPNGPEADRDPQDTPREGLPRLGSE